jgi:LPS-assembly protein
MPSKGAILLSAALAVVLWGTLPAPSASAIDLMPAPGVTGTTKYKLRKPPQGTRVNVEAQRLTFDPSSHLATATGRVVMTYGPYILVATRVTYDQDDDVMRADGNISLREPGGNILEADLLELQNKFRDGFAEHLRLLLTNNATITAEYAKRTEGRITVFDRATYTRCKTCVLADGTPLWQIKSRRVTHDNETHIITHEDMSFYFGGVQLFGLPKFKHTDGTIKRATGFLTPSYSHSKDIGFGVTVPYYIALAPSYDLTLLPLLTSKQGVMPRALWRQRTATGQYNVDLAGIYQLDDDLPSPGDRHWRGSVRTQGDFDINDRWSWGWDITATSDDTFMRRYDIDGRRELTSQIFLTGINDRNFFRARAMHFNNLVLDTDETEPLALPFIEHDYTFDQSVAGGELGITSSAYSLFRDDPESPFPGVNHGTHQTRLTSNLHWQRQLVSDGGLIATPFTRVKGDVYYNRDLPDPGFPGGIRDEETTTRLLPAAGLDLRWPFIRSTGSGQHVITPVAQVIAATNETDTDTIGNEDAIELNFDTSRLFLHDKFSGQDRFEGGTRVNAGLLYSYLMSNGGFVRASAGESFHVAGENSFVAGSGLDDSHSDFVAALAYEPNDTLRLSYQVALANDTLDIRTQEAAFDLDFSRWSLHGGFSDVDDAPAYGRLEDERQVWAAANVLLSGGWSLFGGLRYDFEEDTWRKQTIGIGFDCDCFSFKLAYTHSEDEDQGDLDKDNSVMFSVRFKSLTGTTDGY